MPIIPRYQPRGGPSVGGLNYAGAYAPPGGEDWRLLAQAARAGGAILDGVQALNGTPEAPAERPRRGTSNPENRPTPSTEVVDAKARDLVWRRRQLERPDADLQAVARSRDAAGQGLAPAARAVFDRLSGPREAGYAAAGARLAEAELRAMAHRLSEDRQALGVDEYVQLADSAPDQARAALGSAIGELSERLAAMGAGVETIDASRRELLGEAVGRRIRLTLAADPARAARLLETEGGVLEERAQGRLRTEIEAEQTRRAAQQDLQRLAAGHEGVEDDLEGLLAEAENLAGSSPDRVAAYRGAAIGAWGRAQRARETREDAAWSAVADQLTPDSAVTGWTQLDPGTWGALADWQQQAVRDYFEAPWREPDPKVETLLKTMAGKDPEGFRGLDLGPLASRLTPARYAYWREQQIAARAPGWEARQARFAQDARIIDGVTAGLDLDDDQAWAARVAGQRGMDQARLLADGPLSDAALRAACGDGMQGVLDFFQPWRKEERRREAEENAQLDREEKQYQAILDWVLKGADIEQPYIERWENDLTNGVPNPPKTVGYVPSSGSGVTIGTGVDLGQKGLKELREMNLDPVLFEKLKPYLGAKGPAADALLKGKPLVLTPEEAETVTRASHAWELAQLMGDYNRDTKIGRFQDLPRDAQTVLFSLFLQHGTSNPKKTAPKLWLAATTGDWAAVENELRYGFPKDLPDTRRPADAQKIRDAITAGRLKLKPGTALKPLPPPTPKPPKRPPPAMPKAPPKPAAKGAPKPGRAPKPGARASVKKTP